MSNAGPPRKIAPAAIDERASITKTGGFPGTRPAAGARPLQEHRLIRQLVVAGARAGEVPPEERPHPEDSDHRALAETSLAIVVLHLPAHRVPLGLRNARRDTAVGDDLDTVIGHQHVDQHAVVVL